MGRRPFRNNQGRGLEQAVRTRTASMTKPTGGQTQLFSLLQSCTRALTLLQPGEANLELKRGS